MRKNKGITLIALVITIIVLLILAGVTITLVLGDNGILNKVQIAGKNYIDASNEERNQLNQVSNDIDQLWGEQQAKEWSDTYSKTELYTDKNGRTATIPKGFQVCLKQNMDTIENGLVIRNATDLNEFVWIPVDDKVSYSYERQNFGKQYWDYTKYNELLPEDEKDSVNYYHGYYIGRYEAGTKTQRSSENISNLTTPIVKEAQYVYNHITIYDAKILSEGMYSKLGNGVTSKLCSSYSWDTAIKFLETKNPSYVQMGEGWYGQSQPNKTGIYQVNNIYDMGGNIGEWTTEKYTDFNDIPCVFRGGHAVSNPAEEPASYRSIDSTGRGYDVIGFRVALFL